MRANIILQERKCKPERRNMVYKNLKSAMAAKGVTIETVAKILNVHRNTVQNKIDGESEFSFGQATMISETLFPEYKPSYLFKRV